MPEGHCDLVDFVDDVACNIEAGYARTLVGIHDEIPGLVKAALEKVSVTA